MAWWQPYRFAALDTEGQAVTRQRPWLPAAVAVTTDPEGWTVSVQEAASADELLAAAGAVGPPPPGGSRMVYELTAVIAHIRQALCGVAVIALDVFSG